MRKAPKGKLGDLYYRMLVDSGSDGIAISDLQARFNLVNAFNITKAIAQYLEDGRIVRVRPVANRRAWLFAAQFAPDPSKLILPKTPKKERTPSKLDDALALLTKAGEDGMCTADLNAAFGDSEQTTSMRLGWMERKGLIVGISGLVHGSRSHRVKVWFIKGNEPKTILRPQKPEVKAFRLDPNEPAIIPRGLKPIVCPGPTLDRYKADPSIAGRGVISKDWFDRRQSARAA